MRFRLILIIGAGVLSFILSAPRDAGNVWKSHKFAVNDNDWFMLQRTYPSGELDPARYYAAVRQVRRSAQGKTGTIGSIPWESVGPDNIGGRITSLALDPTDQNILYAGAAAGGVWKSTNGGTSWENIFNESPATGSLLLHPLDPSTLYVGTGEGNPAGVATYPGNGLWKSTDAGTSWTFSGLDETGSIGKLAMHGSEPDRIFAAALGRYRSRTTERGVYRSTDGGTTWEQVLFVNDTTGACDIVIDPSNPDRILAATWTRHRPVTYSIISGTGSGLWLSTNGGDSWSLVTNGFPNNDPNLGRISLAVSPSDPSIVYALPTSVVSPAGIYKTIDGGTSWALAAGSSTFGGEGQVWYNNVLAVHPTNPDIVLAGMTDMYRSVTGGTTWSSSLGSMHVDHHAIEFDPATPSRVVVGNDGGVFISTNTGVSWTKSFNLPVTQFYAGTIDYTNPQRYFGGTQDNGTLRTLTGSVDDWSLIYGGDGFYVLVDPTNPNRIYAESQWGGLGYSTNGGVSFNSGQTAGFGTNDRTNWNTPIAMDFNTPLTLYVGTYRVFRTTNGMASWASISGDLTAGQNGRIGTLTTIDVSRSDPSVLYTGADDGTVSVTTNGGGLWTNVSAGLPVRWVTRVSIDHENAAVAYVTQSGYLQDHFSAHIHQTTDFGGTWRPADGDLPDMPVNDIIIDHANRPYLYAATDAGVMYTSNGGTNWLPLGTGLPEVPVHDLTFHEPTRTLLASTHGRSSYLIDVSSLVSVDDTDHLQPEAFSLGQNYPNPFNPTTTIPFRLESSGFVTLRVYDLTGREVALVINSLLEAGEHTVSWDATRFAAGVYLYRLELTDASGNRALSRTMTLVK